MQGFSLTGKKKKYGLIKMGKDKPEARRPASIFSASTAEDEQEVSEKQRVNQGLVMQSKKSAQKQFQEAQRALEEDPTVFDYDGVYDSMKEKKAEPTPGARAGVKEKEAKGSRYVKTLMERAKIREIEADRIRERRLLKERQQEDALYGDKEKFITSSYKKKLMEQRKWEIEDARAAAREEAEDVTKQGSMTGFYSSLLTKNIALGGDVDKSAKSAYTVRVREAEKERENSISGRSPAATERGKDTDEERGARETQPKSGRGSNKSEAEQDVQDSDRSGGREATNAEDIEAAFVRRHPRAKDGASMLSSTPGVQAKELKEEQDAKKAAEEKKRKREEAVASARARYLARKQMKGSGNTT